MSLVIEPKLIIKAKSNGIRYDVLRGRLVNGWDEETAATKPIHQPTFTSSDLKRAAENGVSRRLLRSRVSNKWNPWSIEEAVSTPPGERNRRNKHTDIQLKTAIKNGVSEELFMGRIYKYKEGWTPQEAMMIPCGVTRKQYYERLEDLPYEELERESE